jgi:hypothetical protein
MVYEKTCSGGATLISTIETGFNNSGLYYKGFELGITANNRLYFEYYTDAGPTAMIGDQSLSDKASIFLSIDNGTVSFGNYDYFLGKINSNMFAIKNNFLLDPTGIKIGYNNDYKNTYSYNKPLTGYLDQFLVFSPPLYTYELIYLNSGFVNNYYPPSTYTGYNYSTGITGYYTGITGYYTYTTGHSVTPTGVITDIFGNQYSGYGIVDLTVTMSGTGIIPLTGTTAFPVVTTSGESVSLNAQYISTFGKNYINLLTKVKSGDIVEVYYPDSGFPYNYINNITAQYDSVKNSFYDNGLKVNNTINYLVYVNGLAQNIGQSINTGTIYNPAVIIQNDYIINNLNEVVFSNTYDASSNVVMQCLSGDYNTGYYVENFAFLPNQNRIDLPWPSSYNLFFNGQKLLSGTDVQVGSVASYGITSTGIYILNQGIFNNTSGQLFALPRNFNKNVTGVFNIKLVPNRFYNNYSEVYFNGIRQSLGDQYIELAKFDTNAGSGIFDIKSGVLYNNNSI